MPTGVGYADKFIYGYDMFCTRNNETFNSSFPSPYALGHNAVEPTLLLFWCCIEQYCWYLCLESTYLSPVLRSYYNYDSIGFHGMVGGILRWASLLIKVTPLAGHDLYYRLAEHFIYDLFGLCDSSAASSSDDGVFDTHYLSVCSRAEVANCIQR